MPTFERLATGAMARWVVRLPEAGATPDDYEAVLAPLYAWMNALTQRSEHAVLSAGAGASARAWVSLAGDGRRSRPVRTAALAPATAPRSAALNAAGIGPLDRDLSGAALRRGYLHGIREVVARLGIRADYVLWGHSHRSGPWPADDAAEWTTDAGARILNTGSWVYQRHFLGEAPERLALLARHRDRPRRRRAAAAHPPAGRIGGIGSWRHPRREARHVAGQPLADAELEHAGRVVRMLDQRVAAGLGDRRRAAADGQLAAPVEYRPRARRPRRGRSRRRAGPRSARGAAGPARPRAAPAATRLALDAEQLLDLQLGLAGRRPRRSASRTARRACPTGSGPASPRSRRRPRPGGRVSITTGYSMPSRSTARATCASSRDGGNAPVCTPITRSPASA